MSVSTGPSCQRRRRRLALLVLPALLLRALIPAGFMPLAGSGGLYLGFCPGAGPLPPGLSAAATHASHLEHAHHGGHGPGIPDPVHQHPACLFSAGAATAFAAIPVVAPPALASLTSRADFSAGIFLPAILRSQSSRGPPVLA
ncbi:MAG TPA: DUF2946 family protein [Steroidobacteraceae bacterium]|nr:DUF2946 family protein [Steroidobacteraceae bacterium]